MHPIKFRPLFLAAALLSAPAFAPASAATFDRVEPNAETGTTQTLATFQKIYIAPVAINLEAPEPNLLSARRRSSYAGSQPPVSDEEQARKAGDLHQQLTRTFARHFTIVDTPASDALTVSAKITRLLASRPTGEQRKRGTGALDFGRSVSAGGAAYTVTLSATDETLYTIEEDYRSNLNDNLPRTGVWQDADDSFRRFSKQLARFVRNN